MAGRTVGRNVAHMNALVSAASAIELPTREIRPRLLRLLAVLIAGLALFVGGGAYLVLSMDGPERFIGVMSILFGLWALVAWWQRIRSQATIVLSPQGLRTAVGGEIPWADIDHVATVRHRRTTLVGIRLRSAERFAASFSEHELAELARKVAQLRLIARGFSSAQLATFDPTQPDTYDVLVDEDRLTLDKIAGDDSLSSIAGMIAFSRAHFDGYDWTIGAVELDRPAAAFVALLNEYRASA
jgi:hypothetical protein